MTFSDRARAWAASMARFAQRRGPRRWLTLLLVVLGLSWLAVFAADRYAEWLWFARLGHTDVLLTRWLVSAALLMAIGGLSLAGLWGNLALARRFTSEPPRPAASRLDSELQALLEQVSASLGDTEPTRSAALRADAPPQSPHWFDFALHAACVLIALAFGLTAIGSVENLLRWLNGRPFGVPDPIFGRDVAFSIFALPLLRPLVTWLGLLVLLTAGAVGIVYGRGLGAQSQLGGPSGEPLMLRLSRAQRTHVASLGAALLVALALAHQVARADLVFSTRGRAVGIGFPGYADAQVQAPAYVVMSAAAVLSAILLVVAAWRGSRRLAWRPVAGYGLVLAGGLLLPLLVQVFVVLPNDVVLERPYLEQAIRLTRQAFAVEEVREEPPPPPISDAASTIDLPLWGQAAIRGNLNQVQALQPYYAFSTAQVDRYPIGGQPRLVLVGARELNPDGLPSRAWSTIHLQFTHGYGAAVALAASASPDGGPEWLTDFPTQQPEIYFGERTTTYAVVNTSQPEQDVTGRYSGWGIRVGGGLRRLAFALALRDPSLLLTQAITSDSELLYERQVQDRVRRLAPFLLPEPEAYLVIADGRLVWVVDAATTSVDYPAVERRPLGDSDVRVSYARASVKAVVDAYDGSVRLFVSEPDDPLIRAEARAYPGLLEPLDAMPAAIRAHLRYPRRLFATQAAVVARFHVQDPAAFARGEDAWRVAEDTFDARLDAGPYYALIRPLAASASPTGSPDPGPLLRLETAPPDRAQPAEGGYAAGHQGLPPSLGTAQLDLAAPGAAPGTSAGRPPPAPASASADQPRPTASETASPDRGRLGTLERASPDPGRLGTGPADVVPPAVATASADRAPPAVRGTAATDPKPPQTLSTASTDAARVALRAASDELGPLAAPAAARPSGKPDGPPAAVSVPASTSTWPDGSAAPVGPPASTPGEPGRSGAASSSAATPPAEPRGSAAAATQLASGQPAAAALGNPSLAPEARAGTSSASLQADSRLVLIQPFSPFDPAGDRSNLVAVLTAEGDAPARLVLQRYPTATPVAGPLQAARRIEQEPDIASQFLDWQRGGALVLRGKALLVPVGPQPLYVEAIFLQRGVRPVMPQLQRVAATFENRVVMEPTLAAVLDRLRTP